MLIETFYPLLEGAGLRTLRFSKRLIERSAPVTVVTRRIEPQFAPFEEIQSIPIHRFPPSGPISHRSNLLEILPAVWNLWQRRHDYDLIHVQNAAGLLIAAIIAHWLTGKPLVNTLISRGDVSRKPSQSASLSFYSRFLRSILLPGKLWRWLINRVDAWIALSRETLSELEDAGLGHKAHLIPNAVDLDRFRPVSEEERHTLREKLGLPLDKSLIISHGRIAQGKRLDVLCRAAARLQKAHPAIEIWLPGSLLGSSQPVKDALDRIINETGLRGKVHFPGPIENIQDYLRAADIFAMPSEREGLPNAMIEAMACGLPIIGSEIGGIVDLIEHEENGLLVPVGDPVTLAAGIRRYIENPDFARQMGEQARQTAQDRHSWDRILAQYLELYRSVLAKKSPAFSK
jgi:glycosyltransferase involved in cell wall biosynthesis